MVSKTKDSNIEVPIWFKGKIHENGDKVVNPRNGEESDLTALELSIYDVILGVKMKMEMKKIVTNLGILLLKKKRLCITKELIGLNKIIQMLIKI